MPETTVQCPGCKARLRLKAVAKGKTHVGCPKCGARVPLAPPEEEEEEIPTVEAAEEEEEEEEPVPARRGRGRRDEDDEEDEEERPRRKKKRKKQGAVARPILWPVALAGCLALVILTFVVLYGIQGGAGFPEPQDGPPIMKPIVLAIFLAVGVGIMLNGCYGIVYQRITIARRALVVVWEEHYEGSWAVVIGIGQCIAGGIAAGAGLYGLVM